ncbi:glycosyltransferase [Zymobacter palmae]|uniref:Glycosyltransferase n=1 Tax=Zymobacter palmae TaxID=33074 RepID=A0A348HGL8_9GAMM|nr:glycosyltransferase [Zymobacter palmae]BBG30770.1 glycosyltransferase [Zymobacter palmae]
MTDSSGVAIVIDNAFGFGGTERVVSNMAYILSSELNVDIYSIKSGVKTFYDMSDANVICADHSGYITSIWSIVDAINSKKYKAVFVITMGKLSCIYSVISKIKKKNIFLNTYVCEHVSYASYSLIVKFLKIATSKYYKAAILLTKENESWIKNKAKIPTFVIPNIAPTCNVKVTDSNRKKRALFVGRLVHQKRVDHLLEYWADFKKQDADGWCLDIVGDGDEKNKLIKYRDELGISASVNFRGMLADTSAIYQESSLFLMTSAYEGFPMVLIESQAYGLPCVVMDCPTGPKEIIGNSRGGFVVKTSKEFVSSLMLLTSNESLLSDMRCAAIKNSKRFCLDEIKPKWLELVL